MQEVSEISRELQKRDDKRPQLSDLCDSGTLEQDADGAMFDYREAMRCRRVLGRPLACTP